MKNCVFGLLGVLASAGCVGQTLSTSDDGGAPAKANPPAVAPAASDASTDAPIARTDDDAAPESPLDQIGTATGPEAYTPAQVAAARAQCALPHGALVAPATVGDMRTLMVGSWFLCSAEMTYPQASYASIDYAADGHWAYLLFDAQGGLVQGVGIDSVGTYTISDNPDAGPSDPVRTGGPVYMQFSAGGGDGYFLSFETGPQRMQTVIGTAGTTEWFVHLPSP